MCGRFFCRSTIVWEIVTVSGMCITSSHMEIESSQTKQWWHLAREYRRGNIHDLCSSHLDSLMNRASETEQASFEYIGCRINWSQREESETRANSVLGVFEVVSIRYLCWISPRRVFVWTLIFSVCYWRGSAENFRTEKDIFDIVCDWTYMSLTSAVDFLLVQYGFDPPANFINFPILIKNDHPAAVRKLIAVIWLNLQLNKNICDQKQSAILISLCSWVRDCIDDTFFIACRTLTNN